MADDTEMDEKSAPPEPTLDDVDDPTGDEDGDGGGSKKLMIAVFLLVLVLGGGGAGLYFSGMLDPYIGGGAEGEEDDGYGGSDGKAKKADNAYFLEIPNMIVNLSGGDNGQPRYLRLSVQLELESASDQAAVEAVMPRVVDQFQTYLRELRVRDLRGSAGIYRLQMELLSRVNAAAYPVEVEDVLFQEILIQ